jgi:hypothetical protein
LGAIGESAKAAVEGLQNTASSAYKNVESGGGNKWLWPLLILAALVLLLWWLLGKGCNQNVEGNAITEDTADAAAEPVTAGGTLDTVTGNYIYDVGPNIEIKLPDGTVLNVGANSTEAKLYKMLTDDAFTVDTVNKSANWIVLDRVYFEPVNRYLLPNLPHR